MRVENDEIEQMIEELASRSYIPVDVNELIADRWEREGRKSSS